MSISAAIGVINGLNECFSFAASMSHLRSLWPAAEQKDISGEVQPDLRVLSDTHLVMRDLIHRAEWKFHKALVPDLLRSLKDASDDAGDILDECECHKLKAKVEGNSTESAIVDFYKTTIQGSFNNMKGVQERMNNLCSQLEKLGLYQVTPGFDKTVRPVTSKRTNQEKIYGRDKELEQVIKLLGVSKRTTARKRKRSGSEVTASTSTLASNQLSNESSTPAVPVLVGSEITASTSNSASNQLSNESSAPAVPVLVLVGMGGVGKTTLAQHVCTQVNPSDNRGRGKDHFDLVIWICADDFDVTRLIKDAIQSASGKPTQLDHLDSLQDALAECVRDKRILIVVDDVWDEALKEWTKFYEPLRTSAHGSMMLVTTRSPDVALRLGTIKHKNHPEQVVHDTFYQLEGLKEAAFWDFFKLCTFGSESSNNDPQLEDIGRRDILPKLKGSPLAAKTLGRMLGEKLTTSHWNNILESELWTLPQEATEILPALQLSYMYLPFHLKKCFSFCAVYPKDRKFEKSRLAEIWAAEGYVEPQGDTPLEDIGSQYFEDLLNRSFFQKVHGSYVIHDLLHEMAQRVSGHDCFIIKSMSDFEKVPQNVRHLYIPPTRDLSTDNLLSLSKHTKLRTLICEKSLGSQAANIMKRLCSDLLCLRVLIWASSNELPDTIGNLKHLRHLELFKDCSFQNIPPVFCHLYNLRGLYAEKCRVESLPSDFSKLINLQRLKLHRFEYNARRVHHIPATDLHEIKLMKNLNQFVGDMTIFDLGSVSQGGVAELELKDKKKLEGLRLKWHQGSAPDNGAKGVLQVLQPPTSLKSLHIENYPDGYLPSWILPENSAEVLDGMKHLRISGCRNLVSLEQLLQPAYVHIRTLSIDNCNFLVIVPAKWFGDLRSLEEFTVHECPNMYCEILVAPSLKKLKLVRSGALPLQINCCSLAKFYLSSDKLTSIQLEMWTLPALKMLYIISCTSLTSFGRSEGTGSIGAFSSLTSLDIYDCQKLTTLDGLLAQDYLPAIEKIQVWKCGELLSLFGEGSGRFPSLNFLEVRDCPVLSWPRELVLPSSLEILCLVRCGDISAWFPSNLQSLTSLEELEMVGCPCVTSIPLGACRINLTSLTKLCIVGCPDLVSIGRVKKAVAKIKQLRIDDCPKIVDLNQPLVRGYVYSIFDPQRRLRSNGPPGAFF